MEPGTSLLPPVLCLASESLDSVGRGPQGWHRALACTGTAWSSCTKPRDLRGQVTICIAVCPLLVPRSALNSTCSSQIMPC